ncbi:MAG: hypothetical protein GY849_15650, partial [Deltaproteobacteria bacterium]|nr:hypothetical protein [Deltaproteobacteria bacterium]
AELIKSRWIRPEDVGAYESIGIDCLKLVERFRGTESLIRIVEAYEQRRYPGNLAELLTLPQEGAYMKPNLDILDQGHLMERETLEEVLAVLREPFTDKLYIDNVKLGGFLEKFKETDCQYRDCDVCGYCEAVASRVISMDDDWRKEMIARFDRAHEMMITEGMAGP